MFHTFGACFLVTSHDETYSFVQFHPKIAEKFHSIKCLQNRAFVIGCSTAINIVTLSCQLKWIIGPVSSYRYNVEMSGNTYDFFALAHLCITTVVVQIYCLETEFFCNFKSLFKRFRRSLAKWHSLCRSAKLRVNSYQSAKVCKHFIC